MTTEKQFIRLNRQPIIRLLKELKKDIDNDCRCTDDPEDTSPGMQVTLSTKDDLSSWSYQTGDNSFTGSCYGDPHWAVIYLYRRSNSVELADQAISELLGLVHESNSYTVADMLTLNYVAPKTEA